MILSSIVECSAQDNNINFIVFFRTDLKTVMSTFTKTLLWISFMPSVLHQVSTSLIAYIFG